LLSANSHVARNLHGTWFIDNELGLLKIAVKAWSES